MSSLFSWYLTRADMIKCVRVAPLYHSRYNPRLGFSDRDSTFSAFLSSLTLAFRCYPRDAATHLKSVGGACDFKEFRIVAQFLQRYHPRVTVGLEYQICLYRDGLGILGQFNEGFETRHFNAEVSYRNSL